MRFVLRVSSGNNRLHRAPAGGATAIRTTVNVMKRDPRLAQLSREHHTALRVGRRLLEGGASAVLGAEQDALAAHFAEEEARFVPLLRERGEAALAERLLREHAALRGLFADAARGEREAETGQALIDHVRFEERELFPIIEGLLQAAP